MKVSEYLREHTTTAHAMTEKKSLAQKIIDHTITCVEYQQFLIQNHDAYYKIESAATRFTHRNSGHYLTEFIDFQKSKQIEIDLNKLGHAVQNQMENGIEFHSAESLIGSLYVIEGSMMGSMLIAKHLMLCPNLKNIGAQAFFTADTKNYLSRWKTFKNMMDTKDLNSLDQRKLIEAAELAFLQFTH